MRVYRVPLGKPKLEVEWNAESDSAFQYFSFSGFERSPAQEKMARLAVGKREGKCFNPSTELKDVSLVWH